MPLAFLLDEHLRGPLWQAILRRNLMGFAPLDVTRVGDPPDLSLGADDPAVLRWAQAANRILITEDRHTMATHLAAHLTTGQHSPGVLLTHGEVRIKELVELLEIIAYAGHPDEFADLITFIP